MTDYPAQGVCYKHNDAFSVFNNHFDGLKQERRNSIADTLELRISCINPSIYRGHSVAYIPQANWYSY